MLTLRRVRRLILGILKIASSSQQELIVFRSGSFRVSQSIALAVLGGDNYVLRLRILASSDTTIANLGLLRTPNHREGLPQTLFSQDQASLP